MVNISHRSGAVGTSSAADTLLATRCMPRRPATSGGGRHCCFQSAGWRNSSSVTSCIRSTSPALTR